MSESSTRPTWHADLARRDRTAHDAMARRAQETAEPLLQQRFDAVSAELHVLRAAVARRDAVLRDLTAALVERDAQLRAAAEQIARPGSSADLARELARRARGVAGRFVRAGLRQR
ncbi:hypothetical protein [Cellulomonas triticagri]|uniref:Uncharacterized protein n=1 Tax=Cellulomonas triticagri TaxID=2483352 RepID=A0A3M2JNR6_9CELL|nr:hypothetical protein [Cellulomonas triticagri]RMI13263.1 hypothetical protein EBM89_05030 [Cellulomonas triticagri]